MGKHVFRFLCLLSIAIVCASDVWVSAQGPSDGPVKLFQGANAVGASQTIPPGSYKVNGKQLNSSGAGASISVQVARGFRVAFCEEATKTAPGQKCEEYGEGTFNLKSLDFTQIKVWKESAPVAAVPPVIVYEAANWGGRAQVFMPGMYRADRNEFGKINDNMAMSAVIAKGFRARFCEDPGNKARGSGSCEELEAGRHNLRISNNISFIEVYDLNDKSPSDESQPVVLYEDKAQGGKMQGFDVGSFRASQNQLGKVAANTILSVSVKSGYRLVLCPVEFVGDARPASCEEFGAGRQNLRNKMATAFLTVTKEGN